MPTEHSTYEFLFLKALALSIVAELIVLFFMCRILRHRTSKTLLLSAGILATALTLPYLWFVLPSMIKGWTTYLLVGEASVVTVETLVFLIILKWDIRSAFLTSLACNAVSYMVGVLI